MTMKKIALIASMGLLSLSAVQAQQDSTLNRTVVVENLYNPTVMDASKINVLPKVEEPTVPKTNIDYATSIRPVSTWNYQAMQPIVREWQPDAAYRAMAWNSAFPSSTWPGCMEIDTSVPNRSRICRVTAGTDSCKASLPLAFR